MSFQTSPFEDSMAIRLTSTSAVKRPFFALLGPTFLNLPTSGFLTHVKNPRLLSTDPCWRSVYLCLCVLEYAVACQVSHIRQTKPKTTKVASQSPPSHKRRRQWRATLPPSAVGATYVIGRVHGETLTLVVGCAGIVRLSRTPFGNVHPWRSFMLCYSVISRSVCRGWFTGPRIIARTNRPTAASPHLPRVWRHCGGNGARQTTERFERDRQAQPDRSVGRRSAGSFQPTSATTRE